jgi:chromosome partitioning protein
MAKILVIASGKGGSGKSTQSRNIIPVALAAGLRVVAFDADPQKTLLNFHAARMKRAEVPQCAVYAATIEDVVGLARDQRDVDLIIVDTPTALENSPVAVKQLLLASDLVLIPSQPTTDDVASVRTLMAAATALRKQAAFVLNRVDVRVKEAEGARHALLRYGPLLAASLPASIEIQRAMKLGLGITETGGRGAADMQAIWHEVRRYLGFAQNAEVIEHG